MSREELSYDWRQRVAELPKEFTRPHDLGRLLVTLAIIRGDYFALFLDGTGEHVILSMFETLADQQRVCQKLRDHLLKEVEKKEDRPGREIVSDEQVKSVPMLRVPQMSQELYAIHGGLREVHSNLTGNYLRNPKANFVIFLFTAPLNSDSQESGYAAMMLPHEVAEARPEGRRCQKCQVAESSVVKVLLCKGCHRVGYCGKACQKSDWAAHKAECKASANVPLSALP